MNQTLEQLIKLQEIDHRLMEIKEHMGDLPKTVEFQELEIATIQSKNEQKHTRIDQIDKDIRHHESEIEDFSTKEKYDIIFFDAFSPSKQPEIWKIENLKKLYKLMKSKSILLTYCASGQFKRTLKEIGFDVEVLEGPPGKKEIVRASKYKK